MLCCVRSTIMLKIRTYKEQCCFYEVIIRDDACVDLLASQLHAENGEFLWPWPGCWQYKCKPADMTHPPYVQAEQLNIILQRKSRCILAPQDDRHWFKEMQTRQSFFFLFCQHQNVNKFCQTFLQSCVKMKCGGWVMHDYFHCGCLNVLYTR